MREDSRAFVPPQGARVRLFAERATIAAVDTIATPSVDPWRLEIIAVSGGSHGSSDRMALSRDAGRGVLVRLAHGAYVERRAFESLAPEAQHVVRIRALAAVRSEPLVVSHWSAAVLHGLPVLRSRLRAVHVTVAHDVQRHRAGLATHGFRTLDAEMEQRGDVRLTSLPRTVLDIAGAVPLEEGAIAIDAALRRGVPRRSLEDAVDLLGPRRAHRRITDAVAFGHPGAESAAESRLHVSMMRAGFEVPVLQYPMRLSDGAQAWLDEYLPGAEVGIEVDGEQKYLDPRLAPAGAGSAVVKEKRREDEVRLGLRALVRPGWVQSGSASAMRALLERVGVRVAHPRPPFAEYCSGAQSARPRIARP